MAVPDAGRLVMDPITSLLPGSPRSSALRVRSAERVRRPRSPRPSTFVPGNRVREGLQSGEGFHQRILREAALVRLIGA